MAGFAARYRRRDDGAGDLCPAVIYRGAELSLGAFFARTKSFSLEAFAFIFSDPDFYLALKSGFILAFGLVAIAIPWAGSWPF
jgi:hypothetical protein